MRLLDELRNDANGAAVLKDWLGEGGHPVEQSLAEKRALKCLACPEHHAGQWWETAKDAIATTIKELLQIKHNLSLRLRDEDRLGMCKICGCCTRLKPWVPIKHIASHTPDDVRERYPTDTCWVANELAEQ